jgi:PAS domain S-box-containing protein
MMPAPSAWPEDLVPQLKAASHAYATVFDTELARTALLESEDRFRLIGDATPAFIWMSDREGNFTYLNKKVLAFTGANAQEHDKGGWLGHLHPDDLAAVLEGNVKAVQEHEKFTREYRVRRHDGVYRWIFDIGNPRFSAEGSFLGFIGSAVDVTDQKMARESLENLGGQLIDAQERERSRIARELHDDICQRLAMISLKVEKVTKGSTGDHTAIGEQLEQIWQQCSDLTGDVQALSHKLHPSALDNLGLIIAVNSFCREFCEQNGAVVKFTHMKIPDSLPREVSLSLFRIIQETLHNAAKYSGVKQFEVDLQGKSSEIELEVSDRGTGFELANIKTAKGLGLVSMRERIHLLNGTISIESTPNVGTRIRARVPLSSTSRAKSA